VTKKVLPPEVLAYFRQQGAEGGKIGGRRSLETMTAAARRARAKKAGLAGVAARRAKATARRAAGTRSAPSDPTLKRDLQAIVKRAAARPIVDTRPADVILGYDDDGLPT
jgi:antitoxin VapB